MKEKKLVLIRRDTNEGIAQHRGWCFPNMIDAKVKFVDYCLHSFERQIGIERKSLIDFIGSIIREEAHDDMIRKLLLAKKYYESVIVIIEATKADVIAHKYDSGVHHNSILGRATSIVARGVPVLFAGTPGHCQDMALNLFERAARHAVDDAKCFVDAHPAASAFAP